MTVCGSLHPIGYRAPDQPAFIIEVERSEMLTVLVGDTSSRRMSTVWFNTLNKDSTVSTCNVIAA